MYVDLALNAMEVGISYLETDPAQARTKLEEAKQYFIIALDYEFDDYNRWVLQSHIYDINFILGSNYQTPTLMPIGLVILVVLVVASGGYLLRRRMACRSAWFHP